MRPARADGLRCRPRIATTHNWREQNSPAYWPGFSCGFSESRQAENGQKGTVTTVYLRPVSVIQNWLIGKSQKFGPAYEIRGDSLRGDGVTKKVGSSIVFPSAFVYTL